MSKKLPLEIRKNYSIKDQGNHWELVCDACSHKFALDKPAKGAAIEVGNLRFLNDHAATHPLPGDEGEGKKVEEVKVIPPPKVTLVKPKVEQPKVRPPAQPEKAPVSQLVSKFTSHAHPSPKNPNPYMVELNGKGKRVSPFKDPSHINYCQVERTAGGFRVTLYAANPKHASLVGERIISRYMSAQGKEA